MATLKEWMRCRTVEIAGLVYRGKPRKTWKEVIIMEFRKKKKG